MIGKKTIVGFAGIAGIVALTAPSVLADPLAGEVLKFSQLPLGGSTTTPPGVPGHDELSTAVLATGPTLYNGVFAADDFSDTVSNPISHVQWWGSYIPNATGANQPQVQQFLISFESDIPSNPTSGFSTPGQVLADEVVTLAPTLSAADGNFTETPQGGPTTEPLFRYNAELSTPFPEQANTIYWLKIVALTNPTDNIQWGWHNRDYTIMDPLAAPVIPGEVNLGTAAQPVWHFQDDAVAGSFSYFPSQNSLSETNMRPLDYNNTTDGFPAGAVTPSEDLAFNLYYNGTVPEPIALPMLAAGMFLMRRNRQRRA